MKHKLVITSFLLVILAGCEDGKPVVGRSQAYPSPDGAFTATLEEVDNGMGFGLGALYDEVHLTRQGEAVGKHGDSGRSVVFYAESAYKVGSEVKITWIDSRHLRVELGGEQRPGRAVGQQGDIAIEFRRRSRTP
ncbi:hypothetical protein [Roseateles sp.]|uniref:hypothetical protein n=1 Tax=Roseateles sp. TaxID=1971397 RepID=UPI0032641093